MKISSFVTKHDRTVDLGDFSILVGPNNAGKSQTLRDIHDLMKHGLESTPTVIVDDIDFEPISSEKFLKDITWYPAPNSTDRVLIAGIGPELQESPQHNSPKRQLENVKTIDSPLQNHFVKNQLLQFKVALLDASSRLEVASETDTYDVEDSVPGNILQKLYTEQEARRELRNAFQQIFEKDVLLDYSSLRKFRLKVSDKFNNLEENMVGPNDAPGPAQLLDEQGAGYRGLAGVIIGLLLSENRVVLLDEPEAFLHPAQSRRFGRWLAQHVREIPGQVIIATHNSHFLSGILSADPMIKIHRLNRSGDTTAYHSISSQVTSRLSSDPLLSSQRIIDAVFHQGVVVCEADSDSTIYRYVSENYHDGGEFLFTYGHNKQTIPRITNVLTQTNVPCAAIVDIDVIKTPGTLKDIVESVDTDKEESAIHNVCNELNISIRESDTSWDEIKEYGINSLPEEMTSELETVIERAETSGVFIVPVGELESWIDIDRTKGSQWVIDALDHLNEEECPRPLANFVQRIHKHLSLKYSELVEVSGEE